MLDRSREPFPTSRYTVPRKVPIVRKALSLLICLPLLLALPAAAGAHELPKDAAEAAALARMKRLHPGQTLGSHWCNSRPTRRGHRRNCIVTGIRIGPACVTAASMTATYRNHRRDAVNPSRQIKFLGLHYDRSQLGCFDLPRQPGESPTAGPR